MPLQNSERRKTNFIFAPYVDIYMKREADEADREQSEAKEKSETRESK